MAVFDHKFAAPLKFDRVVDKSVARCGHSIHTVVHSPKVSRADGTGNTSFYRGQNIITAKLPTKSYSGCASAIRFLQARVDANYETFQIYNPAERAIDTSGSDASGMYYVKLLTNVGWIVNNARLHDYVELKFEEDLNAY